MADSAALRAEYARLAPGFERRWRRYLAASAHRTLGALAPRPGERILDAGCGTGVLLRRIAASEPAAELAGIDISPEMLSRAAGRLPANTRIERGDVRSLPFAAGAFDAVVLASVLHYLPEAGTALGEAARVLRAGGRLIVTDWCGDAPAMRMLAWWLNRRRGARVHLRRERELRDLLARAGFRAGGGERYGAGFPWRLTTLAAVKSPAEGA